MSRVSNDFKTAVRDWVAYDDKILKASNAIKRVKEQKKEIGDNIIHFMDSNNLQKKEIKFNNYRLQYRTTKSITPLTKKYIEATLVNELQNEEEAKEVVKLLYNTKKRMEIIFSYYFQDEEKAKELVELIYSKRIKTEKNVLKRKIQRVPVTIDSGPLSEQAENNLKTPDNTDSDD